MFGTINITVKNIILLNGNLEIAGRTTIYELERKETRNLSEGQKPESSQYNITFHIYFVLGTVPHRTKAY